MLLVCFLMLCARNHYFLSSVSLPIHYISFLVKTKQNLTTFWQPCWNILIWGKVLEKEASICAWTMQFLMFSKIALYMKYSLTILLFCLALSMDFSWQINIHDSFDSYAVAHSAFHSQKNESRMISCNNVAKAFLVNICLSVVVSLCQFVLRELSIASVKQKWNFPQSTSNVSFLSLL